MTTDQATCKHIDVTIRVVEQFGPIQTSDPKVVAYPKTRSFLIEVMCKDCLAKLKGQLSQEA